jgi:hypothetical protein
MTDMTSFSWQHRDVLLIAAGVGAVLLAQTVLMLWVVRRLDELANIRERISRLADGLALLTDTTEAGLATIARELQALARPAAPARTSRASVSKRVASAARRGDDLAEIAGKEALSESEVRLHLALARDRRAATSEAGGLHGR